MTERTIKYSYIRTLMIALVLAFLLVGLSASAAFDGFYLEHGAINAGYDPPTIYVKATKSKDSYDTIDTDSLNYSVKVRGQCRERDRLWSGYFEIRGNRKTERVDYPVNKDHRSIGPDHGQGWEAFGVNVPFIQPQGQSPVELCNAELDRAGDDSARKRLLSEGFNLTLPKAYYIFLQLTCERHEVLGLNDLYYDGAGTDLPVRVRCYPVVMTKGPPPRTGQTLDPPIQSAAVVADPQETVGRKCPVYVNFKGTITGGDRSPYATYNTEYRFVGDHNYTSEWLPVSVVRGESRTVHGRRFIQEPDTPPGFKTPGARDKIPTFHGWMMLEVRLQNGTKRSQRSDFSVDCNIQPRIRSTR